MDAHLLEGEHPLIGYCYRSGKHSSRHFWSTPSRTRRKTLTKLLKICVEMVRPAKLRKLLSG